MEYLRQLDPIVWTYAAWGALGLIFLFLALKARWGTFLMLGLCVGLGAFIYYEGQMEHSEDDLPGVGGRRVVDFERGPFDTITIKNAESKIELKRKDDGLWYLEEPVKDLADSTVVAQLLTAVETLRSENDVPLAAKESKEQLKEFGISDSNTKVKFTGQGKTVELIFGKDAAVEGRSYIYVEGATKLYAITNDLRNEISQKPEDFRDRKLTELTSQKINKAAIKTAAGEMELERKNGRWMIVKPLEARGNESKITDLIAQATNAHIEQFLNEPNLAAYGLNEPKGTLTLTIEDSDKPVVIQYGASPAKEGEKEKTYVKLSSRDAAVLVSKSAAILEATPNDLRDHRLLRVESEIVDRMTIEMAGGEKLVLARKGESWVRKVGQEEQPINAAVATRLLMELPSVEVVDFISDAAADLAQYGLDQPTAKVTFSSYASENTAETTQGEKPIVAVLFGAEQKEGIYAKLDTEPFIVQVPPGTLRLVPRNPIQLQDPVIYSLKPEEIASLEVQNGPELLSLEKDNDSKWNLTKGDGNVNQANVQALVSALANLRALRWIGPVAPEQELDHPTLTVSFASGQGDQKTSGKLTVGVYGPEDGWYAQAEGKTGTFQLNKGDHDVFMAPLTDRPPPAPAANLDAAPSPAPVPMPESKPAPAVEPSPTTPPPSDPAPMPAPKPEAPAEAPPAAPEVKPEPTAPAPPEPAPEKPAQPPETPPVPEPAPALPAPPTPETPAIPEPPTPPAPAPAPPAPASPESPAPALPTPADSDSATPVPPAKPAPEPEKEAPPKPAESAPAPAPSGDTPAAPPAVPQPAPTPAPPDPAAPADAPIPESPKPE